MDTRGRVAGSGAGSQHLPSAVLVVDVGAECVEFVLSLLDLASVMAETPCWSWLRQGVSPGIPNGIRTRAAALKGSQFRWLRL